MKALTLYRYNAYTRPPFDGCVPAGYEAKRVFLPPRLHGHGEWYGYVDYRWKLQLSIVWRYELFPEDDVEAAFYVFYLEADRNQSQMDMMIESWTSRPIDELRKDKDILAAAAITIMESRNETPNPTPTPILASTGLSRF